MLIVIMNTGGSLQSEPTGRISTQLGNKDICCTTVGCLSMSESSVLEELDQKKAEIQNSGWIVFFLSSVHKMI